MYNRYTRNCVLCGEEFSKENPVWNSDLTDGDRHVNGMCRRCIATGKDGIKYPESMQSAIFSIKVAEKRKAKAKAGK